MLDHPDPRVTNVYTAAAELFASSTASAVVLTHPLLRCTAACYRSGAIRQKGSASTNISLWIVQGLLAAAFMASGLLKITKSRDQLIPQLPWLTVISAPVVRLIGAAELAGALGLILPGAFNVATVLTPLAATGLAVVMALAMGFHSRRKEAKGIAFNAALFVLAAVVMIRRFPPNSF